MAAGSSARRHAQAVFQIARDQDRLDKWLEDLDELASAFGDPDLRRVLDSPKVRPDQKQELAAQRLAGLDTLARNLASLLVSKGRVALAEGIASEYRELVDDYRGVGNAEVTTAVALDAEAEKRIADQMSEATGKQIKLTSQVDPDIVGGIVIKIGDMLIDGSTRTKLSAMRSALAERRL